LKSRLIAGFWIFFAIYSVYWGSFYYISLDKRNLSYVDFAVSFYFGVLIILYLVLGAGLIKQIQANYDALEGSDGKQAPGINKIIWILVIMCSFMFLRMIFVSLNDIAKTHKIEPISKNTDYWPVMLAIISTTNILATFAVFVSIYLIHESEREIAESSERSDRVNDKV